MRGEKYTGGVVKEPRGVGKGGGEPPYLLDLKGTNRDSKIGPAKHNLFESTHSVFLGRGRDPSDGPLGD